VEEMGKNICTILKKEDIGDMGIGAMIVFIAMVLVAGIAASVLVQTANRLEIQAMQTGEDTMDEVATGLGVTDIEGLKVTDIRYMGIMVVPRAGSTDIDLSQTYVEISDGSVKNVLRYNSDEFHPKTEINGNIFNTTFFDTLNATRFGVIVLEDGDDSCARDTPVINRGDKVLLIVNCSAGAVFGREVGERTDVWGIIQPEEGAPGVFAFRTPASYPSATDVYNLY
jgi:flagellin FlaB